MGLTPDEQRAAIVRNFPAKTGHDLAWWVDLLKKTGPAGKRERTAWLQENHGLGQLYARAVVAGTEKTEGRVEPTSEELVDTQYAGAKAAFRPIHDRLVKWARAELPDVRVNPCRTYVSLFRRHQFAVIAVKRDGIYLGLALPGEEPGGAWEPAKNLGCVRITHQLRLAEAGEVDGGVLSCLRRAYEADV
ncbi:MAG TPA: DUF5655 domain-containing protein [bacterium]|nr:DUF5655 domain-containing protein [bacterium]